MTADYQYDELLGEHPPLAPIPDTLEAEYNHPAAIRAARLRDHYANEGKIVYDRHDRWTAEHVECPTDAHTAHVEECMYVIKCSTMDAVAVCESWQFTRP